MENNINDIIIKALQNTGYEIEIDNVVLIIDDYDTNTVLEE